MSHAGFNGDKNEKKKKIAILSASAFILVAMVVAVAIGISTTGQNSSDHSGDDESNSDPGDTEISASKKAIKSICQPTEYKETCEKSLTASAGNTTDPKELIRTGFKIAVEELNEAIKNTTTLKELAKEPHTNQVLEVCRELMEYAIDDLNDSFNKLGAFEFSKLDQYKADLKIWLTAALTYQQTCLDGFANSSNDAGYEMKEILKTAMEVTSNGLTMVAKISSILNSPTIHEDHDDHDEVSHRRLLASNGEFPSWVGDRERKLLSEPDPAALKPDLIVAQDGSGKYKTVKEALVDIPKKSNRTFVVYVKEGIYREQVILDKTKTWIMFVGDGPTKTKITSNDNFGIKKTPTWKTATFAAIGSNFMAKDIGFENTAGPKGGQAVALRVQSDMSIFYNCQMDGYQDTLYVQTHRQFYRDCTISGTIDFIFGVSSSVFQNCNIFLRKPGPSQPCIVTAEGKMKIDQHSGIILHNCSIRADPELYPLRQEHKGYLGRPWKEFSTTVVMQTFIDDSIQSEGWLAWNNLNVHQDTCFYAEYGNRGPGAVMAGRVNWKGVQKKLNPEQVSDFTVGKFIQGDDWIKPTGVPYISGMM